MEEEKNRKTQLRQSIKGNIYAYSGVMLGFLNSSLLFPEFLTTAEIGVVHLLVTYSMLLGILAGVGFSDVIYKLFGYFRDKGNNHNGIVALMFGISILGATVTSFIFYFFEPYIIDDIEANRLYWQFSWLVAPLTFFSCLFNFLDAYNVSIGHAVTGSLLKDVVLKASVLIVTICFILVPLVDYKSFIYLYAFVTVLPTVLIAVYLKFKGHLFFWSKNSILKRRLFRKVVVNVSVHGILRNLGNILAVRLDIVMIGTIMGVSAVGIYTTTYFISSVILVPSKIATKVFAKPLSEAFIKGDYGIIQHIYQKASLNQTIIGVFIGGGLVINLHNIFTFYATEYSKAYWVIPLFCLTNIAIMMSGVVNQLIQYSAYYARTSLFMTIYLVLLFASNLVFIPAYGFTGAALATFISTFIIYAIRIIFVYKKMRLQPFRTNHLVVVLIGIGSLLLQQLIPRHDHFFVDIMIRSIFFTIMFGVLIWKFSISKELNEVVNKVLSKVRT